MATLMNRFRNFRKIRSNSRWTFSATNLANIHLATNLIKFAIFHHSRNIRKIPSSRWALQQISVGRCKKYDMNILRSFKVLPEMTRAQQELFSWIS